MVIYGNTGEDLGQFNIEVDLDGSLTNTVSIVEGDLEDLPPALNPRSSTIEKPISLLKSLTFKPVVSNILIEIKQFLQISFKIIEMPNAGCDILNTVVNSLVSAATMHSTQSSQRASRYHELVDHEESCFDFSQARKELLDIFNSRMTITRSSLPENLTDNSYLEFEDDLVDSKQLVDILTRHYHSLSNCESVVCSQLPQVIYSLSTYYVYAVTVAK